MTASDLDRYRKLADSTRAGYRERADRVRADQNLSGDGKQRQLARLYATTRATLKDYQVAERKAVAARRADLERDVLGASLTAGSNAISARDAADRAALCKTPAAALDLLRRADASGDDTLSRAIARRATEMWHGQPGPTVAAWENVFAEYLATRPQLVPAVDELGAIEQMETQSVISPYTVSKPIDVDGDVLAAAVRGEFDAPERTTAGPLRDPSRMETTAADRADWAAAAGTVA